MDNVYDELMEQIMNEERGYEPMFDDIDLYAISENKAIEEEIKTFIY